MLGIKEVVILNHKSGELSQVSSNEIRNQLFALIRVYKPQIVFHPFPLPAPYTLSNMSAPFDDETFARVAEEYAGRLYAVAYRMLGHRADAEDAVQRALMKCFAARYEGDTRALLLVAHF